MSTPNSAPLAPVAGSIQGSPFGFRDPEPWPEVVNGAALLGELSDFIRRFVVLPRYTADAIAAYVTATYVAPAFDVAPILFVWSPTKRCGKTRLKDLLALLVHRPFDTVSASPAALFRTIENTGPTALMDEAEFLGANTDRAQALREILNVGYCRGAGVPRCVGDNHEVRWFSVFGFKIVVAIGRLWDSLEDRAIPIAMRRRLPGEQVERFRRRKARTEAEPLRRKLARWTRDHSAELEASEPSLPEFLDDRAQDLWEPLFAVALAAGGDWYEGLVDAARAISGTRDEDLSEAVQLLTDVRRTWAETPENRQSSAELVTALQAMAERPWSDPPLTANRLAKLLCSFGIRPKTLRLGDLILRGYERSQFEDAFSRYLPPEVQQAQLRPNSAKMSPSDKHNNGSGVAGANSGERPYEASIVADVAVSEPIGRILRIPLWVLEGAGPPRDSDEAEHA